MKIKLNISVQSIPLGCFQVSDEKMKDIMEENRWQKGEVMVGNKKYNAERRVILGEAEHRINGQIFNPECFCNTEWMEWRDG